MKQTTSLVDIYGTNVTVKDVAFLIAMVGAQSIEIAGDNPELIETWARAKQIYDRSRKDS